LGIAEAAAGRVASPWATASALLQRAQDFDVADGLSSFIQTWLIDHVDNFDRKFVTHFLAMGVDPLAVPKPD